MIDLDGHGKDQREDLGPRERKLGMFGMDPTGVVLGCLTPERSFRGVAEAAVAAMAMAMILENCILVD